MSRCAYCGANGDTVLCRDHVVPRSRGGPDNAFNIVMACHPCNSDKRDSTAIEWLGDRCPEDVRAIEDRVNAKLRRDFTKRDYKPKRRAKVQETLYGFTVGTHGYWEYTGEVVSEDGDTIRMEVADAFMLVGCALWQLSGELKDFPRNDVRLFNDLDCCLRAASRFQLPMNVKPTHYQ